MRILFFSSQFFNAVNYLLAFSKSGHELAWAPLVPSTGRRVFEERLRLVGGLGNHGVRVHPIYLKSPDNKLKNLVNARIVMSDFCTIFRTLIGLQPDAVLVSYVLDAFPIVILKRLLGCSVFVMATGGDINLHPGRIHVLIRRVIYSRSDMIFAVSNELRLKILHESGRRALLLPTAVDTSFFRRLEHRDALRAKWHFGDAEIVLLTVSNLEKHKGVDVAIRTVDQLRRAGTDNVRLVVVGRGSQVTALKRLVADLGLERNVLFLGEMGRDLVLELYSAADIFILSSRSEGLPFALLEAMACEAVCVASSVGDIPAVLDDGENGFIVWSVSPTDFSKKVEGILANRSDLNGLARNARRTVLERMDMAVVAKNMIEAICAEKTSVEQGRRTRLGGPLLG